MPANIVKSAHDERLWGKAKELAAEAGRGEDWAYIIGIFKRMKGDPLKKALDLLDEAVDRRCVIQEEFWLSHRRMR